MSTENGWNEWSKHVLKELERLNNNYESLRDSLTDNIQKISNDINDFKNVSVEVDEIKKWKDKVDEIWSPSQMKDAYKELEKVKIFKTQIKTAIIVINVIWGIIVTLIKLDIF